MSNHLPPEDNLPLIKDSDIELQAENSTISGGVQAIQGNENTQIHQDIDGNQISVQEIREGGVFVVGNVTFQSPSQKNVRLKLYQSEREPPPLLPYLVNRTEQELELDNAGELLLKQVPPRPLVCIIHGNECQSHENFLERLRQFSLPKSLKLDPTQTVKQYRLVWPTGLKNLDELRERLCKNLVNEVLGHTFNCPEEINATLKEINASFCKYPSPIVIYTYILTEDWQQQGFEILNKLLEFWQNWPELISGQKLIVCVFIKYQLYLHKHTEEFSFQRIFNCLPSLYKRHSYKSINKKISTKLEALNKSKNQDFNRFSCTILSELTDINRMHVENWVRSEEMKQFVGEEMIQKLIDEVKYIFYSRKKQTIPMDDLADELIRLLKLITNDTHDKKMSPKIKKPIRSKLK